AGTHILIDGQVGGQARKLIAHSGRNGFFYALERANGQTVLAKPYAGTITWTKGIDQKTGLPVDYDPNRDIQVYSGEQNMTLTDRTKKLCPVGVPGDQAIGVKIVPRPVVWIEHRHRIARAPQHLVGTDVIGTGDPHGAAAGLPGIVLVLPGLRTRLAGRRDHVFAPCELAGADANPP